MEGQPSECEVAGRVLGGGDGEAALVAVASAVWNAKGTAVKIVYLLIEETLYEGSKVLSIHETPEGAAEAFHTTPYVAEDVFCRIEKWEVQL